MDWTKLDVPERYQKMYRFAVSGYSPKLAIRTHCIMCVGWERAEVARCTATGCPLYPYRNSGPSEKAPGGSPFAVERAAQAARRRNPGAESLECSDLDPECPEEDFDAIEDPEVDPARLEPKPPRVA